MAPLGQPKRHGIIKDRFVPDTVRKDLDEATATIDRAADRRCAGVEYLDIVDGGIDTLLYWRTFPWDHAPGALIASEAGLQVGRLDGSAYQPGLSGNGLLTAHPAVWAETGPALDTLTATS